MRKPLLLSAILGTLAVQAGAMTFANGGAGLPEPLDEFLFKGTLADSRTELSLTPLGGDILADRYAFDANEGLFFIPPELLNPAGYSIELFFMPAKVDGYNRLVDFKERTSDTGLYIYYGALNFYTQSSSGAVFTAGERCHLVITRDAETSVFSAYANGALALQFTDSGSLGVFSGAGAPMYFLQDDNAVGGEATAGEIYTLRIFNGVLDAAQAAQLHAIAIPEPSTLALISAGCLLLCLLRRRTG